MPDLRKLKDKAAEHVARGRYAKAAETLAVVVKADPGDIGARQKLGDALRRAGDGDGALRVYQDVADRYARDGQLIKAVAICRIILDLDPRHAETQQKLAELYAKKGGVGVRLPPGTLAGMPPARQDGEEGEPEDRVELALVPAAPARPPPPVLERVAPPDAGEVVIEVEAEPAGAAPEAEASAPVEAGMPPGDEPPPPAPHLSSAATPFEAILGAARAAADEESATLLLDEPIEELEEPLVPAAGPAAPVAAAPPTPPAGLPGEPMELEPMPAPASPAAAAEPPALPRIPIFSDLSREAFVKLAERMVLHVVDEGAVVVREGEAGASFFCVASGALRVEKTGPDGRPLRLASLGEGAFFGEMAILSGEPRAATVVAEGPCELLEIRADVLLDLARDHPHVVESLARFYRRRLLANAMATGPLFRSFGREERAALMARFRTREVPPGAAVVTEGEPSDGLYVVLSGALEVWKRREGEQALAGRLREGDVFGEMSCLRKGPASATVRAARRCVLLRLPRQEFDELVMTYPQILELVSELSDQRQHGLAAIASGEARLAEDGLLLT